MGTNTDRALNDVKDAVTAARTQMPDTTSDPVVQRLDFTGRPILTFAVADGLMRYRIGAEKANNPVTQRSFEGFVLPRTLLEERWSKKIAVDVTRR